MEETEDVEEEVEEQIEAKPAGVLLLLPRP
jgi:hypothetical protein